MVGPIHAIAAPAPNNIAIMQRTAARAENFNFAHTKWNIIHVWTNTFWVLTCLTGWTIRINNHGLISLLLVLVDDIINGGLINLAISHSVQKPFVSASPNQSRHWWPRTHFVRQSMVEYKSVGPLVAVCPYKTTIEQLGSCPFTQPQCGQIIRVKFSAIISPSFSARARILVSGRIENDHNAICRIRPRISDSIRHKNENLIYARSISRPSRILSLNLPANLANSVMIRT